MNDDPVDLSALESAAKMAKEKPEIPRTFMGPAYLLPLEKGLYGLFRDITMEDPETKQREKVGKPIGPLRVLRKAEGDEHVYIRTVHPKTGEALNLTEVR